MTDIYLSYSEPNLALAQDLKKDVESCSSLQVKLEDHDWEERDDCDFCGNINKAKMFILIATEHSNITAWVIDHDATKRRRSIMQPPTLDFSSYEQGMTMLKYVLRMVTGARRFHKRHSQRQSSTLPKRDQKPTMPQRQRSAPRQTNDEDSNAQMPAMPQRQESATILEEEEEPKKESSFANANQLPKPTPRRRSSTLEVIMENYQRIMNRVQASLDATDSTTDL